MSLSKPQEDILRRLRHNRIGLSTRDIARSIQLSPAATNKELLGLQNLGHVSFEGLRWKFKGEVPSPVGSHPGSDAPRPSPRARSKNGEAESTDNRFAGIVPTVDRNKSAWRDFRNLCEYYAECVRLDQRVSVHGKAEDECKEVVCLSGRVPDSLSFQMEIPEAWSPWAQEGNKRNHTYLFLGYPLDRFQWRDPKQKLEITFCSPVFMVPCRWRIDQTRLTVEATGHIRINEGWLERRLKNLDERRAFIQLCGLSDTEDHLAGDDAPATWSEVAHLLRHYYRAWCRETLDPGRLSSFPPLSRLEKNGIFNRAALIWPKSWKYTRRLHQELLELANNRTDAEFEQSALVSLFPHTSEPVKSARIFADSDDVDTTVAVPLKGAVVPSLNREQTEACEAAAEARLSVIVGPPGTGKSRVVQAVLTQQVIGGSNALFASRNHQALEAVVPRVNAITDPWPTMLRLAQPFGSPADTSLLAAINELVGIGGSEEPQGGADTHNRVIRKIEEKASCRASIQQIGDIRARLMILLRDLAEAQQSFENQKTPVPQVGSQNVPSADELEAVLKEVIASQAPPTVWQWLLIKLGWLRPTRNAESNARRIDGQFRNWLDPEGKWPAAPTQSNATTLAYFEKVLEFLKPMAAMNDLLLKLDHNKEELKQFPALEEVLLRDLKLGEEIEGLCTEILRDKAYAVGAGLTEEERTKLTEVLAASRNRSGLDGDAEERRLSDALRRIFPILLRHFPLAATTNLSIGRDIPLEPALYDLLVLDEASQCDIASVIPILFRARRTIVVGDPLQLSHITTLSAATDKQLRTQFKLGGMEFERFSYRTSSMFELAASSPRVELRTNLRQHHRCHPEIAEYCSETFYKGGWTILTSHGKEGGLRWTHIDDDCQSAPGGGVTSENQISTILEELRRLAAEKYSGSLGVVTPFTHQASRIRDRAHQDLPDATLRQWRFLVSTADGFQGDERDLVLMSIPGGEGMPEGSKRFLSNGPNRFNVAVSRARRLLHVFADSSWAQRSGVRHIEELRRSCERSAEAQLLAAKSPFRQDLVGPVWEPQLAEAMQRAGISFHQQYPACGRFLDFAIFGTSLKLNVEVDGESFHRTAWGDRKTADLDRDQALIADGWTVVRFWVYQLREDMEGCVQLIQQRIQESGK